MAKDTSEKKSEKKDQGKLAKWFKDLKIEFKKWVGLPRKPSLTILQLL